MARKQPAELHQSGAVARTLANRFCDLRPALVDGPQPLVFADIEPSGQLLPSLRWAVRRHETV
jgi:hypothetical protein